MTHAASSCALVTVAIGSKTDSIGRFTHPPMAAYARRIGSDFIVLKEQRIDPKEAKFEKFQLYDLLARYERVIYLDTDVIVMPDCPNLFDVVPTDKFGAFFDSNVKDNDADIPLWREEEISYFQEAHGAINWQSTYFNSGVMIISRRHREIFDYRRPLHVGKRVIDQTQLNYNLQKLGFPIFDIGPKFNHFVALSASPRQFESRFKNYILHYAGYEFFYPGQSLEGRISEDIDLVNSSNLRNGRNTRIGADKKHNDTR